MNTSTKHTEQLRLTRFQYEEAQGSDISNPNAPNHGWPELLVNEMKRVAWGGPGLTLKERETVTLDAECFKDLSAWADAVAIGYSDSENYSAARSMGKLAEKASDLAYKLKKLDEAGK